MKREQESSEEEDDDDRPAFASRGRRASAKRTPAKGPLKARGSQGAPSESVRNRIQALGRDMSVMIPKLKDLRERYNALLTLNHSLKLKEEQLVNVQPGALMDNRGGVRSSAGALRVPAENASLNAHHGPFANQGGLTLEILDMSSPNGSLLYGGSAASSLASPPATARGRQRPAAAARVVRHAHSMPDVPAASAHDWTLARPSAQGGPLQHVIPAARQPQPAALSASWAASEPPERRRPGQPALSGLRGDQGMGMAAASRGGSGGLRHPGGGGAHLSGARSASALMLMEMMLLEEGSAAGDEFAAQHTGSPGFDVSPSDSWGLGDPQPDCHVANGARQHHPLSHHASLPILHHGGSAWQPMEQQPDPSGGGGSSSSAALPDAEGVEHGTAALRQHPSAPALHFFGSYPGEEDQWVPSFGALQGAVL